MTTASAKARRINAGIWEGLYSGGLKMSYPNDVFVRVTHRLLDPGNYPRVLDYGFGSGQNLVHLARRGFDACGAEVSASALTSARAQLAAAKLKGELKLLRGAALPYPDGFFDAVIAWSVLEYNDWAGLRRAVRELDRVLRPGGIFLAAINAPGDFKHKNAASLGRGLFALDERTGQAGARVIIVARRDLPACFPGRKLTIGRFEHSFAGAYARHWIVSYEK